MPPEDPVRNRALDGLRGVAVLAVLLFHVSNTALPGAWLGVDLFFVLSGYLITRLLRQELERSGRIDLPAFLLRRSLRTLPALMVMLVAVCVYAWAVLPWPGGVWRQALIAAAGASNWTRAFSTSLEGPLSHTWTLSAEQQFYLVWPLLLIAIWPRRPLRWIAAVLAAALCWRAALALGGASCERLYNGLDTRCDALLVGCALALAPLSAAVRRRAAALVPIPIALLTGAVLSFSYRNTAAQAALLLPCVLALAWVLVAALQPGRAGAWLSVAPLVLVGRVSYSLYLWQVPVLNFGTPRLGTSPLAVAGLTGLTVLLAIASYRLIERPFIALGRAGQRQRALEAAAAPLQQGPGELGRAVA